jgi:hypothetical protein
MPLPNVDLARIRRWSERKLPDSVRDQIRIEVDEGPGYVTVFECRPPWHPDVGPDWTRLPVARLRRNSKTGFWTLYYPYRNRGFRRYEYLEPSTLVDDLLVEIDEDPTCIFWG